MFSDVDALLGGVDPGARVPGRDSNPRCFLCGTRRTELYAGRTAGDRSYHTKCRPARRRRRRRRRHGEPDGQAVAFKLRRSSHGGPERRGRGGRRPAARRLLHILHRRRRRPGGRLRDRRHCAEGSEPGRGAVQPARRGGVRRLPQRRVHLREERQQVRPPGRVLPREPAEQMQSRGPGGVRGRRAVPSLGRVRGGLPGCAPPQGRGEKQLPDRRQPGAEVQDRERPVQAESARPGRGGAERDGASGLEGPRAELEELRVLRRLVPFRQEGVQNGRGDPHRQAAVQVENSAVRQALARSGVSEFGGRDHGEEEERSPGQDGRAAGAGHSLQQRGGDGKVTDDEEGGREGGRGASSSSFCDAFHKNTLN